MTAETKPPSLVAIRQDDAAMLLTVADLYAPRAIPGGAAIAIDVAQMIARVRASAKQPVRVSEQWAVHWGSAGLNDGRGFVELYDDEQDAREHAKQYGDHGQAVRRTLLALHWEAVPAAADEPAGSTP